MNSGAIWWGQIGNSIRLINDITNALRDYNSVVLQVPKRIPWRQEFYDAIDIKRTIFSGERRLVRCEWSADDEPGRFVLEKLCSSEVCAEYWPGVSYAAYLGSLKDILLNEYYVWITGIHSKTDISKWTEFISQYMQFAKEPSERAVFILEYDGAPCNESTVKQIEYTIEDYDCRVFCLETAVAMKNTELREYQAELSLRIGEEDPELSNALLSAGTELLEDPVETARSIMKEEYNSQHRPFEMQTELQINSAVWNASIVLLFPMLEHFRMHFVTQYYEELLKHLPINNSNGDQITDPFDLELGSIYYIVRTSERAFLPLEVENVRLCRNARNLLAHNKPVPYSDVAKILSLQ